MMRRLNTLTDTLFNWNFHLLEVVSCRCDPQLEVVENYENLEILLIDVTFLLITYSKAGTQGADKNKKERIYSEPGIKGLKRSASDIDFRDLSL